DARARRDRSRNPEPDPTLAPNVGLDVTYEGGKRGERCAIVSSRTGDTTPRELAARVVHGDRFDLRPADVDADAAGRPRISHQVRASTGSGARDRRRLQTPR